MQSIAGYVYLVWAENTDRYKVGRSSNPERRLIELRQQSCYPLRLIKKNYASNCVAEEARIHKLLSIFKAHGEWFNIPSHYLKFVDIWFCDPDCIKFDRRGRGKVIAVLRDGSRKKHSIESAMLSMISEQDRLQSFTVPSEEKQIALTIALLATWKKDPTSEKVNAKLKMLIGITPVNNDECLQLKRLFKSLASPKPQSVYKAPRRDKK